MIGLNSDNRAEVQVWLATGPLDMRKSFDGLAERVRAFLGHDPLSGSLFVFRNKSGRLLKILWWDQNGLAIFYKRIERGTFHFPTGADPCVSLSREQLLRLLSGMECVTRCSA